MIINIVKLYFKFYIYIYLAIFFPFSGNCFNVSVLEGSEREIWFDYSQPSGSFSFFAVTSNEKKIILSDANFYSQRIFIQISFSSFPSYFQENCPLLNI